MPTQTGKKTERRPSLFLILILFLLTLVIIFVFLGIYFFHFRRPPIDEILASNGALYDDFQESAPRMGELASGTPATSKSLWEEWTRRHNLVAIGNIFDSCNKTKRTTIGKIGLLQDPAQGLVTETVFNITLQKEFTAGEMTMSSKYNGHRFIERSWNMCRDSNVYQNPDNIVFDCPVAIGTHHFIKRKKVPTYLPKGTYTVDIWAVDDDGKVIVCGESTLTL